MIHPGMLPPLSAQPARNSTAASGTAATAAKRIFLFIISPLKHS